MDSFHAKDLILKNIVSAFSHDSLHWMGIEHTEVVGVMPSEFTTVEIRKNLSVSLISRDLPLVQVEKLSPKQSTPQPRDCTVHNDRRASGVSLVIKSRRE